MQQQNVQMVPVQQQQQPMMMGGQQPQYAQVPQQGQPMQQQQQMMMMPAQGQPQMQMQMQQPMQQQQYYGGQPQMQMQQQQTGQPMQMQQQPMMGQPMQMQQQPMGMMPMGGNGSMIAPGQMMDIGMCNNLMVKQTRNGWFLELLGCTQNTEFNISTMDNPQMNIMYAIEDSSFCNRFLCHGYRPFTIKANTGPGAGAGPQLADFYRPFRCMPAPMKLCCHQVMIARLPGTETEIGRVQEDCYWCVPQYKVLDPKGTLQYNIHMPTCCGGCCVDFCAEGGCYRIPFYIYPPNMHDTSQQVGKIVKIWGGLMQELFTDADKFELIFPPNINRDTKINLLGGVMMINQMHFEKTQQNGGITV